MCGTRVKSPPQVAMVSNGLWSIPVPIPDNPLGYVLCYAFEGDDGLTLVDPGWDAPESYEALLGGLRQAGAGVGDVEGVVVTHYHPDHGGLAEAFRASSGAWVAMHPADADRITKVAKPLATLIRTNVAWLRESGAPEEVVTDLLERVDTELAPHSNVPVPDRLLRDGDLVPSRGLAVRAIHTPGHTPGHICLYDESRGLLLTGDHVLPRITPNVGFHPMASDHPLGDFLDSLRRLRGSEATQFLPAHEWSFTDIAGRVDELLDHHHVRLEQTMAVLAAGPLTGWQVAERLIWRRRWEESGTATQRAALAETLAHLIALQREGRAVVTGAAPTLWAAAPEPTQ